MSDLSLSSDEAYFGDNGEEFRGKILNSTKGRYALIEKIGYGAFSSVWLSYNVDKNEYNAIKIQNSEDYQDGKYEVKLLNKIRIELENIAQIEHEPSLEGRQLLMVLAPLKKKK